MLEHIEAGSVERVIANLCSATDAHPAVHHPGRLQRGHPHQRATAVVLAVAVRRPRVSSAASTSTPSFVSPWAALLERRTAPARRLVAEYETQLWDLRRENRGTRTALMARDRQLAQLTEVEPLRCELEQARNRARAVEGLLQEARAEARKATREARALRASKRYRLGSRVLAPLGRARRLARRLARRTR